MQVINIHEAKTHLSRFVEQAASGEEIIIAKAGKPIAKLVALQAPLSTRKLGTFEGKLKVPDDFDAPLPDEVLENFSQGSIGPRPE